MRVRVRVRVEVRVGVRVRVRVRCPVEQVDDEVAAARYGRAGRDEGRERLVRSRSRVRGRVRVRVRGGPSAPWCWPCHPRRW